MQQQSMQLSKDSLTSAFIDTMLNMRTNTSEIKGFRIASKRCAVSKRRTNTIISVVMLIPHELLPGFQNIVV